MMKEQVEKVDRIADKFNFDKQNPKNEYHFQVTNYIITGKPFTERFSSMPFEETEEVKLMREEYLKTE